MGRYHKVSQRNSEEGICCSVNYCRSHPLLEEDLAELMAD